MRNEPYLIDRITAIELFDKMIARSVSWRVLRLTGSGKIARAADARVSAPIRTHTAVVELVRHRSCLRAFARSAQPVASLSFGHFVAHDEYANARSSISKMRKLCSSKMTVDVREHADAADYRQRQLTECFLRDLAEIGPANPIVLFSTALSKLHRHNRRGCSSICWVRYAQLDYVCNCGRQVGSCRAGTVGMGCALL